MITQDTIVNLNLLSSILGIWKLVRTEIIVEAEFKADIIGGAGSMSPLSRTDARPLLDTTSNDYVATLALRRR